MIWLILIIVYLLLGLTITINHNLKCVYFEKLYWHDVKDWPYIITAILITPVYVSYLIIKKNIKKII